MILSERKLWCLMFQGKLLRKGVKNGSLNNKRNNKIVKFSGCLSQINKPTPISKRQLHSSNLIWASNKLEQCRETEMANMANL